jgi:hypothetical protein
MMKLVGNICVYFRLPMSNPLHKLSFIFNVIQEQPIAIEIFTLLIVKYIKKRMSKNVTQIVVKLNMFKQIPRSNLLSLSTFSGYTRF